MAQGLRGINPILLPAFCGWVSIIFEQDDGITGFDLGERKKRPVLVPRDSPIFSGDDDAAGLAQTDDGIVGRAVVGDDKLERRLGETADRLHGSSDRIAAIVSHDADPKCLAHRAKPVLV